jgi:hypothetical protein
MQVEYDFLLKWRRITKLLLSGEETEPNPHRSPVVACWPLLALASQRRSYGANTNLLIAIH